MLAGLAFCEMGHSTHGLLFRGSAGVTSGGQQQFAMQTLRVHLRGFDNGKSLVIAISFRDVFKKKRPLLSRTLEST